MAIGFYVEQNEQLFETINIKLYFFHKLMFI